MRSSFNYGISQLPNQDSVLEQFYEQRNKRGNFGKRHSLLQKNTSYFNNNVTNINESLQGKQSFNGTDKQMIIRQQLKTRKMSALEQDLMKKYEVKSKQNMALPLKKTPTIQTVKYSNYITGGNVYPASTSHKASERKRKIEELQKSFHNLTAQNIQNTTENATHNLKQKMQKLLSVNNNPTIKNQQNFCKTKNNSMQQNIKIVNKVRSNSMKLNGEQNRKYQKVNIKEFVQNNSFCQEDEPLLVLAHRGNKLEKVPKQDESWSEYMETEPQKQYRAGKEEYQEQEEEQEEEEMEKEEEQEQEQEEEELEEYMASPNFKMNHDEMVRPRIETFSNEEHNVQLLRKYPHQSGHFHSKIQDKSTQTSKQKFFDQQNHKLNKKVEILQQKLDQFEKQNKKQSKFIQSVQSMRMTVQNLQNTCSLKELWRWLKVLPTHR